MWSFLKRLFSENEDENAVTLYNKIVNDSREKRLFTEFGVIDSVEGRIEMLYLHLFILSNEMLPEKAKAFQAVLEQFFSHMDANLREMGVGDLTVPKKIKQIASSHLGRQQAYQNVFSNKQELENAFKRNIPFQDNANITLLVDYTHAKRFTHH